MIDGTEDECFVDAAVDDPPFSGRTYKASYTTFEQPNFFEQQDDFEFVNPSGSLWRMSREESETSFWRSAQTHTADFVVQPLVARMIGSTRLMDHRSLAAHELQEQRILVERGSPTEWSAALRKPIQDAWAKAPGNCKEIEIPSGWVQPAPLPGLTEANDIHTCLEVPVHRLMAQHETNDLVQGLVTGSFFHHKGDGMTIHFCGEVDDVEDIIDHICDGQMSFLQLEGTTSSLAQMASQKQRMPRAIGKGGV